MSKNEMLALFLLAGIPVQQHWQLENGYWPAPIADDVPDVEVARYARLRGASPWWLVLTPFGLVAIGWRKRVISIDWYATLYRGPVTTDQTTMDSTSVHAWSEAKAVEYLATLKNRAASASRTSSTPAAQPETNDAPSSQPTPETT